MLANRHIPTLGQCQVCSSGPKDIKHLMFTCSQAEDVWKSPGLQDIIMKATYVYRSGSIVLEEPLHRQNNKSLVVGQVGLTEMIIVGVWYIWWQRREFVKGVGLLLLFKL